MARPDRSPAGVLRILGVGVVVIGGLLGLGLFARYVSREVAALTYWLADADHTRLVVLLLGWAACLPLLGRAATAVRRRHGRWVAAPLWVFTALSVLVFLGFVPGRRDNGERARDLTEAAGGSALTGTGEVFTGVGLSVLLCLLVSVLASWALLPGPSLGEGRPAWWRVVAAGAVYVGTWVTAGAVVLASVGDTPARGTWLDQTAEVLPGGDVGITGDFPVGLDTSVVDVVDCDTAAERLRVDGRTPELDGCRKALLVAATGRYDAAGTRRESGELVAVVVQVRTQGQLDDLAGALDDAEVVGGGGLPEPSGQTLATPASAAYALVVAAEDTGDIPLPDEGAGRRPLSRALAYVVIGSAVGLYLAPPED